MGRGNLEIENGSLEGSVLDLISLLSSDQGRDFLVRTNGDQVKISELVGKMVGFYFSAKWCGPCRRFTPKLEEVYEELSRKGDFEIVYISFDRDDEEFKSYFAKMPWLAIPYSDSDTRKRVTDLGGIKLLPHFVILDGTGKVLCDDGMRVIENHGAVGYPFTPERFNILREEKEVAKKEQSLSSILVSGSRDFLISNGGNEVSVLDLEEKMVGLYFWMSGHRSCVEFTAKLIEFYKKLKEKGENFEVVLIPFEEDEAEEDFNRDFGAMPWLALPLKDKHRQKLIRYFEIKSLPKLVVIGPDGKTLHNNVTELIEQHGVEAYPFSPEKLLELAQIEKAQLEALTLGTLLVHGERDFVIGRGGCKVPIWELVDRNILLYFSAHWCPPCRAFLPKFIKAYHDIKAKDKTFEVIFVSSDRDQSSFDDFYSKMPWLALPHGDERRAILSRAFRVRAIPAVVAIGPNGKLVNAQARQLIAAHGADAYPFDEEHSKQLQDRLEEKAKGWPEKLRHELHEAHELRRTL